MKETMNTDRKPITPNEGHELIERLKAEQDSTDDANRKCELQLMIVMVEAVII